MAWDKDPYRILGLSRSASLQDVKSAYRQLAQRLHPDKNHNNAAAAMQFQDVTYAYELLSDDNKRQAYDHKTQAAADAFHFTMQITPSRRSVRSLDEHQVIYLLADIIPDLRASEASAKQQTRLNLTLVLDQSNSMKGVRIEKVKSAAHKIIDSLSELDIISIVTFNDRADTIVEATPVKDKMQLKARVSMITPSGGTAIHTGLEEGVRQCRQFFGPRLVNHIILLTDGHTYGDQEQSLMLADELAHEGIGISAMGLGSDWNDRFLDMLASRTGGASEYISSAGAVVRFLDNHVKNLVNAFAERMMLAVATDPDVVLDSAFKLAPNPQPLSVQSSIIPLGGLQADRQISVLLQIQLPAEMKLGDRSVARISAFGDILTNDPVAFSEVGDFRIVVQDEQPREETPTAILEALSKLTLYKLQERAQEALDNGNASEATRRLENLATRFFSMGQDELGRQALTEAQRVQQTQALSERGRKTIKYKTRHLLLNAPADVDSDPDDDDLDYPEIEGELQ